MKQFRYRETPPAAELAEIIDYVQSEPIALICWHRGLRKKSQVEQFLHDDTLLPVDELNDLESAWNLLENHLDRKSKIVIYGDYDADGAVAAAILWRFLSRELDANATVYIPDRHEEGYGLNEAALEKLAAEKTGLLITVDCGVRDAELIKRMTENSSMEIIVTDHHQPGDTFPSCPVVHPLFPHHESANSHTSGGVVAWKFVRFIEEKLARGHRYSDSVIDLAGLSLVTDIMPLVNENRVILRRALRKAQGAPVLGLRALAELAQVPLSEISAYHFGYVLGPRLNASGRIGNQYTSVRLLSTDNQEVARQLAQEAHEINSTRQELTKELLEQADAAKVIVAEKLVITAGNGWEDGIIGLVAGKLMNRIHLPTIAVTIDTAKGIAKGSARSFGDFDITAFFTELTDIFERFGGHQNAAGFTLKAPNIEGLSAGAARLLDEKYADYKPVFIDYIDAEVKVSTLTDHFFEQLAKLEPFGPGNGQPLFAIQGKVAQFSIVGKLQNHVRITLDTAEGPITVMAFDGLSYLPLLSQGDKLTVIGRPKQNEYRGRKELAFYVENITDTIE